MVAQCGFLAKEEIPENQDFKLKKIHYDITKERLDRAPADFPDPPFGPAIRYAGRAGLNVSTDINPSATGARKDV